MIWFSKNPERVGQSKLLGIQVTNDLKWQKHIDNVYSNTARKLYTIIMLSKAGLKQEDLVHNKNSANVGVCMPTMAPRAYTKNSLNAWNQSQNEPYK